MTKKIVLLLFLVSVFSVSEAQKPGKPAWPPGDSYKAPTPPTPIDGISWLLMLAGAGLGLSVYGKNKKKA